jgi:uncharacterized protein CbrC (UPF0167 family)
MTPPTFFYSPHAYSLGIIEQRNFTCPCCGETRTLCYTGNFYSADEVEAICPWCIADGSAAEKYDGSFVSDFEGLDPGPNGLGAAMSPSSMAQVSRHTPGYASWQGDVWLGHCGEACIFLRYVGSQELAPVWAEVRDDAVASGWGEENIRDHMHKDGDMTGYLFRCQHCGRHRLHVDAN